MSRLDALEVLYDRPRQTRDILLPEPLAGLYGRLGFPAHPDRPYCIGNFVTSLDGVVALNTSGTSGGGDISGSNQQDRMLMGLLRAVADVIIVGAGTLRATPKHRWTAEYIYPDFAKPYGQIRTTLRKTMPPLNVIVTASGKLDTKLPIFQSGEVPVLVVTTQAGAEQLEALPSAIQIAAVQPSGAISAQSVLEAAQAARASDIVLVEGGPQLMGSFFAEKCLNELFLTLAPQVVGRDNPKERPGLVSGQELAPKHPVWGTLMSLRRGGSHLFLRYAFNGE